MKRMKPDEYTRGSSKLAPNPNGVINSAFFEFSETFRIFDCQNDNSQKMAKALLFRYVRNARVKLELLYSNSVATKIQLELFEDEYHSRETDAKDDAYTLLSLDEVHVTHVDWDAPFIWVQLNYTPEEYEYLQYVNYKEKITKLMEPC